MCFDALKRFGSIQQLARLYREFGKQSGLSRDFYRVIKLCYYSPTNLF